MQMMKFIVDAVMSEQQSKDFSKDIRISHLNGLAYAHGLEVPYVSNCEGKLLLRNTYRNVVDGNGFVNPKIAVLIHSIIKEIG